MLGVYVHFPYCVQKCPYCDFASYVVDAIPHRAYADAVIAELEARRAARPWASLGPVTSLYFGGGTPSLWAPRDFGRVIAAVDAQLGLATGAEITVEANPGKAEAGTLAELRAAGANRVSFGTQSFAAPTLAALGRWHRPEDSREAVPKARAAGFERVSADLIYGAPGQDAAAARADAEAAVATGADHLSAYALTLDAKVPMARAVAAGEVILPDEDAAFEIEEAVLATLAGAGYQRYEISNHAQPGAEAVHNTLYWTGHPYLALGASAAGFFRPGPGLGARYTNHPHPDRYLALLKEGALPTGREEPLDPPTLLSERLFLGLRRLAGIDLEALAEWSGLDPWAHHGPAFERALAQGLLRREGPRLIPTALGLRFHNSLVVDFL